MRKCLPSVMAVCLILPSVLLFGREKDSPSFQELLHQARANPDHPGIQSELARLYENRGDDSNAVRMWSVCVKLEPDQPRHRVRLIRGYLRLGRPDLARPIANAARTDFGANADVCSARASVEYQMGDYREALDGYARALELSRATNAYLLSGLAKSCRELKLFSRADGYFLKAVAMDRTPWSFYEYGKLLEDITNYRRAVWAYEKARSLSYREDPEARRLIRNKLSSALYGLGMEQKKTGHPDLAVRTFRKITEDRELRETPSAERAAFWLQRIR